MTALARVEMHRAWKNKSCWAVVVVAVAAAAAEKVHSSLDLHPFDHSGDYSRWKPSDERQVDS